MANKTEQIAKTIIDGLKNGTAPWIKSWAPDMSILPHNPTTGTRYKGANLIYLAMQNKSDPRWVTFLQAQKNGWKVKRGSKGTTIQYWQFEKDKKTKNEQGETVNERIKLASPILRHYYVFNGEDIEGIPEYTPAQKVNNDWQDHAIVEKILKHSGAEISHVKGDNASYNSVKDRIVIPEKRQFETADRYYATAIHELGHWTGHESRLNRKLGNVFGSKEYAREELRAEIASYILGMELKIGHDPGNHIAYVESWINILEEKPTEIFQACADAEKIESFILAFEQDLKKEEEMDIDAHFYIVTEPSFVCITENNELNGDFQSGEAAKFHDPASALKAAIDAKKKHAKILEGRELLVFRVDFGDIPSESHVLRTGLPIEMRAMWKNNIGGEFPEHLLNKSLLSDTPENQNKELTGKRFISFFVNQKVDDVGNIKLELQQELQKDTADGVIRLDKSIEISIYEKSEIDMNELQKDGYDGVVLIDNKKPVAAIAINKKQLYKNMYQAAKGLEKHYLNVPYDEKDSANNLGALWDKKGQKLWYIPEGLDKRKFANWERSQAAIGDDPEQQFAEFIREMGGNLKGSPPVMDGVIHRIPEMNDKPGNLNIVYVGHLDGIPAGWVKNHHNKAEKRWKMNGVALSDLERKKLINEGKEKKKQRNVERQKVYEQKSKESSDIINSLDSATGQEHYFRNKGIEVKNPGVKIDSKRNIIIPLSDIDGKQWSHQKLQSNGFKQYFKDARIHGTFFIVGADSVKSIKGDFFIAEGYTTAATINEVMGCPVISCTSGNNLSNVAIAIRERFPNREIYIMADDDSHLIDQGKINSGIINAKEAAANVNGKIIHPDFAGAKPNKNMTDFNDMAKVRGKELVKNHITNKLAMLKAAKRIERQNTNDKKKNKTIEEIVLYILICGLITKLSIFNI